MGLAALTLLCVSLLKTYYYVNPKELKRRAREQDPIARGLYRAVAYGISLRMLLWLLIGISGGGFFVLLARSATSPIWALAGSAILIWLGFVWMPHGRVTALGTRAASWLTPIFAFVLRYVHPLFDWLAASVRRHRPVRIHTGLYHKEDLIDLISRQQVQADNRITKEELNLALHALTFGEKFIRDHLTPRRVVKLVSLKDSVGPILISELHGSGHSRFPVYRDTEDNIVGTLYLRDMINAKAGGTVADIMKKDVYYVNEERPIYDALQAFLKTKHHLFIVVNSFEEFVGVITIEDVLEEIIGRDIVDEFDQYDDMRAVAARQAESDRKKRKQLPETMIKPEKPVTEE